MCGEQCTLENTTKWKIAGNMHIIVQSGGSIDTHIIRRQQYVQPSYSIAGEHLGYFL